MRRRWRRRLGLRHLLLGHAFASYAAMVGLFLTHQAGPRDEMLAAPVVVPLMLTDVVGRMLIFGELPRRYFVSMGVLYVVGVVVFTLWKRRLTTEELRKRRLEDGLCPTCEYDLTGNISGVCPECGERVGGRGPQSRGAVDRRAGGGKEERS